MEPQSGQEVDHHGFGRQVVVRQVRIDQNDDRDGTAVCRKHVVVVGVTDSYPARRYGAA